MSATEQGGGCGHSPHPGPNLAESAKSLQVCAQVASRAAEQGLKAITVKGAYFHRNADRIVVYDNSLSLIVAFLGLAIIQMILGGSWQNLIGYDGA